MALTKDEVLNDVMTLLVTWERDAAELRKHARGYARSSVECEDQALATLQFDNSVNCLFMAHTLDKHIDAVTWILNESKLMDAVRLLYSPDP